MISLGGGSTAKPQVILSAALLLVLLVVGCSGDGPESPPASTDVFRLMDAPQEDADVFRFARPEPMQDLLPDTTRSLGSAGEAEYWVALKENGALCLITTFLAVESEFVGMTCGDEDGSLGTGLSTKTVGSSQPDDIVRSEAYLLPDDVDATPLNDHLAKYLLPLEAPKGLTDERAALQEDINFFAIGPGAYKLPEIELKRTSGETFTFRTLG